ncbi:hypothetical protein NDA13_002812 [Ustilago tritici]|nr:hypothetical protein NDA13_002812 [Ustilago tritici]
MWRGSSSNAARTLAAGAASTSRSILQPGAATSQLRCLRTPSTASKLKSNRFGVLQNKFGISPEGLNYYTTGAQPGSEPSIARFGEQPYLTSPSSYSERAHEARHSHTSFKGKEKASDSSGLKGRGGGDVQVKLNGKLSRLPRVSDDDTSQPAPTSRRFQDREVYKASHPSCTDPRGSNSLRKGKRGGAKSESNAKEEVSSEDPLASAQDQLRTFFAKRVGNRPILEPASPSNRTNNDLPATSEPVFDFIAYADSKANEEKVTPTFSPESYTLPSDSASAEERKSPWSTLANLRKADWDEYAGLYQSQTAWNPNKEYALMQDGPERDSFLRKALQSSKRKYIAVIIDGDNLLFDPRHINQGYEGGMFVFNELRERIARKHKLIPHMLDLRIRVFASLHALATILVTWRVTRRELFFDFMQGLMDCSMHNYVVNVGKARQAADMRVKAALADALRDPACFRAYLGGLDDFGYMEDLNAIQELGLLESRVNLIQVPGFAVASNKYREYAHRALNLDYLFKVQEKVSEDSKKYVSSSNLISFSLIGRRSVCQDSQRDDSE